MNCVSVAMCTFDGSKYLTEQLESIARQTLLPCEMVVCDDGSSDNTIDILQDFASRAPFKVRIYQNELNLRPTKNFEKAISLCEGDLIALCDQDDYWLPQKLQLLTEQINCTGAGGIFTNANLMDDQSKTTHQTLWGAFLFTARERRAWVRGDWAPALLKRNVVTGATLIFRRNLQDRLLPIPQCWVHDGWIAWMIALHSKLLFLPMPLVRYRVHQTQQVGVPSSSFRKRFQETRITAAEDYNILLERFSILIEYLETTGMLPSLSARMQMRVKHSEFRASLAPARLKRLGEILLEHHSYRLYSRGLYSMLKDLMV